MINSNDESRIALQRIKYLNDISKHYYEYLCGIESRVKEAFHILALDKEELTSLFK